MGKRSSRNSQHHEHDPEVLIDLYLLRCQVEGKSPNAIRSYQTLNRLSRIAKVESFPKHVRHITPSHI